jgi:NADPH2:quinone reductase
MRAIRVHELGKLDVLRLDEDVPGLTPGPGQVHIAVHATGCNFADTLVIAGTYQYKPKLPFSPGLEVAGEVISVGPDVAAFKAGDRVMANLSSGGYAEEVIADAASVEKMPEGMDFVTGAAFPVAYSTGAVALMHKRVALQAGEVLLVHGAAGGVGLACVDIGKAMGATVVATASTDEKLAVAAEYGADHLINTSTENIRDRVKELVGGADVVYDPVGGDVFKQSLRCINSDGRLVIIGFAGGEIQQIPSNHLLVKNVSVVGMAMGAYRITDPSVVTEGYRQLREWFEQGKLRPRVSHVFPLAETAEALDVLLKRQAIGKVVVKIR